MVTSSVRLKFECLSYMIKIIDLPIVKPYVNSWFYKMNKLDDKMIKKTFPVSVKKEKY